MRGISRSERAYRWGLALTARKALEEAERQGIKLPVRGYQVGPDGEAVALKEAC